MYQAPLIKYNTLALYKFENNALDSSPNGYNLTTVGTVPYVTPPNTPPQFAGNYVAGTFSDANYFSTTGGLLTSIISSNIYTIEFYANITSITGFGPVLVYFLGVQGEGYIQYSGPSAGANAGKLFVVTKGTVRSAISVTVTSGVWHQTAITFDGTSLRVYFDRNLIDTVAVDASLGVIGSMTIGRYPPANGLGLAINGYLNNLRFSNVVRTTFPTLD